MEEGGDTGSLCARCMRAYVETGMEEPNHYMMAFYSGKKIEPHAHDEQDIAFQAEHALVDMIEAGTNAPMARALVRRSGVRSGDSTSAVGVSSVRSTMRLRAVSSPADIDHCSTTADATPGVTFAPMLTLSLPQGTAATPKLANPGDSPLSHPIFAAAVPPP